MTRSRALTVGLTGGIGAGKSAVLDRFAALGALTVDSDEVARDVVEPGTEGLRKIVAAFGPDVLTTEATLDRARLGSIVFADAEARARLEAIVHPLVRTAVRRRFARAPADAIVVNAVPLLVEAGLVGEYDRIVVVEAPAEVRIARLIASRGMSRAEAMSRIAAQASEEQRRSVAWRIIENDGTLDHLRQQVDDIWAQLQM